MRRVKKCFAILLAVLMITGACPMTASAESVTDETGEWKYKVISIYDGQKYGEITEYDWHDIPNNATITIPSELNGCKIIGVGYNIMRSGIYHRNRYYLKHLNFIISEGIEYLKGTFFQWDDIDVTFPSSLKYIGSSTFLNVDRLTVHFAEGLEGIDTRAFENTSFEEREMVLPESLKCLSPSAFDESNITSLHIGKNTKICKMWYADGLGVIEYNDDHSNYEFSQMMKLETIDISADNHYLCIKDNALYTKDMKSLIYVLGDRDTFRIPDSVETICRSAFAAANINHLIIGSGIKTLPEDTFAGPEGGYDYYINKLSFAPGSRLTRIDDYAFSNANIREIVLPATAKTIGSRAFYNARIRRVTFDGISQLTSIQNYAFYSTSLQFFDFASCPHLSFIGNYAFSKSQLKSVDLKNTRVTVIEQCAFSSNSELEEFILSDYPTAVKYKAFYECPSLNGRLTCSHYDVRIETLAFSTPYYSFEGKNRPQGEPGELDGFSYEEFEDSIRITGYNGEEAELVIPDTINGKPVTVIGKKAFYKADITSVVLPSQLEKIEREAFRQSALTAYPKLPHTLRFVGFYAFAGVDLQNNTLELNDGLEVIDVKAFPNADYSTVILPDSLVAINEGAYVMQGNTHYGSRLYDIEAMLKYEFNMKYPYRNGDFEDSIREKSISVSEENPYYSTLDGVLYNKDKSVLIKYPTDKTDVSFTVPSSVKIIDRYAFGNVQYLKELNIPNSVEKIYDDAFVNCVSLERVTFEDGFHTEKLGRCFEERKNLREVIFGENTEVGDMSDTFKDSGLETIKMPSRVGILSETFSDTNISDITIPNGLQYIGNSTFYRTKLETVILPPSVLYIDRWAFGRCENLTYIQLGNVRSLGECAFANCTALESIDLTGVKYDNSEKGNTFKGCDNLKKLYFTAEERAAYIAENEFQGNETVENIVVGSSIAEIEDGAFADCTNLSEAIIAETVDIISDTAFENCGKLTIVSTENSPAILYAKRLNIPYRVVQSFVVAPIPDQAYTGKAITPALNVTQGGNKMTEGKDYNAVYRNNINVGTASVSVVGIGDYKVLGTTVKFKIIKNESKPEKPAPPQEPVQPASTAMPTSVKKLKRGKKRLKVTWKKVSGISGYQIQYSRYKSFKKAKTVTASKKLSSKTIKKLRSKKRYYVRVRTYVKQNGQISYSKWSKAKSVKTK